jgi:RHS repeat-associated protein
VNLAPVAADRLGSIGKFYPYGTERPSATGNDKEKFTGYYRDASTGLDYADQRYEQPGVGRFMTPDPYGGSAKASDPGSWNRYAYVGGDPVNRIDPEGLDYCEDAYCGKWFLGSCYGGIISAFLPSCNTIDIAGIFDFFEDPLVTEAKKRLPDAMAVAKQALSKKSCKDLLKGTGTMDPATTLDSFTTDWSLFSNRIKFGPQVQAVGQTDPDLYNPRVNLYGGYFGSVTISINSGVGVNGPANMWNKSDPFTNATTLLHELAHANALLQPGDVNGFGAKDVGQGNIDQQNTNVSLIQSQCMNPLTGGGN